MWMIKGFKVGMVLATFSLSIFSAYAASEGGNENAQPGISDVKSEGEIPEGSCPIVYTRSAFDKKAVSIGTTSSDDATDTKTGAH